MKQDVATNLQIEKQLDIPKAFEMDELILYRKWLNEAATKNLSRVFTNKDQKHAAIAFDVFFRNTRKSILMIVDSFKGGPSNDPGYVDSLAACLKQDKIKARILILYQPNYDSAGFKLFLNAMKSGKDVQINQASENSKDIIRKDMETSILNAGELQNIAVFDDCMYRFEYMPSNYRALLSFNDCELAYQYTSTINRAFNAGIPIPLPTT